MAMFYDDGDYDDNDGDGDGYSLQTGTAWKKLALT